MISKFATLSLVLIVGACTYRAGYEDNPVTRKFSWFSYLDAADLRESCTTGGGDRYRIVYNGHYREQVRTYDITLGDDGAGRLHMHVFGGADLRDMRVEATSFVGFLTGLTNPWQGIERNALIAAEDGLALKKALQDTPANAVGLELESYGFYWLAATCSDGRFSYRGWKWPGGFDQTAFVPYLMAIDPSGIALNPPRVVPKKNLETEYQYDRSTDANYFRIRLGAMGLDHLP